MRHTAPVLDRPPGLSARLALAAALLSACPGPEGQTSSTTSPTGNSGVSVDPSMTGADASSGIILPTTGDLTGTAADTTGAPMKLDLPDNPDLPGCGAVDVLFVIDNSKSMGQYQMALADAFPKFVDAMIANLPQKVDLHVGITTTDFFCTGGGQACCPDACPIGNTQCQIGSTPEEIAQLEMFYVPPTEQNNMTNGAQGRLFVHEGMSFFQTNTSADPTPLKTWFTGAAIAAGEQGSSLEMPVAAAAYSASPANAEANAGFLRDKDAVLLVFFLTNDPDASLEPLKAYKDMLLAAKSQCGGDACILTAGLIKSCVPAENQKLWQFMKGFGEDPIWGDIEDKTGYVEVVGQALAATIGDACINIPVG